jgi:hypothetical protein
MISPASGIRRPSYNGAPAMQRHDSLSVFAESYDSRSVELPSSSETFPFIALKISTTHALQRARARVPASLKTRKIVIGDG